MNALPFRIREAQRGGFDHLWRLDQQCFPPEISYSRLELAVYMRRSGSFTLMAENSLHRADAAVPNSSQVFPQVLGFIVAQAQRNRVGHIITIDVLQAARRSGVGSKLLTAAEERLRSARCAQVHLETAVNNMAALAFYKRHGYYVVKTASRYYANGVDAFILKKDLLPAVSADNLPA